MTTEGAIVSILKAASAVTAAVGTRIAPFTDPQNVAMPKLTFQRIRTDRSAATGGYSNSGPTGYSVVTLQIDCWANQMIDAKNGIAAARKALHGYSGTISGVNIGAIQISDERELPAGEFAGQQEPIQRQMIQIKVQVTD